MKKVRHILYMILSCCLLCSLFSFNIYAVEQEETTVIKVAFYPLDGFFEYDENGNESGYGVDYLNELSKYENIVWEYVPCDSWEGIKQMMIDGTVDVRMPVSQPLNPSGNYDYTVEPIINSYHAIMTLKSKEDYNYQDYELIAQMKIAVTSSLATTTSIHDYLSSIGVQENHLIYYDDYNSCKEALINGSVDGLISNVMDLTSDMQILDKFAVLNNYITTWKGNPKYAIINNAMTHLELENPSFRGNLYEKYYPERAIEPFSKEEKDYLNSLSSITIAVYDSRKPVSYFDTETNTYKGIAIDYANLLSEKIGVPFKYTTIDVQNSVDMLDQVDLIMPLTSAKDPNIFLTSSLFDSSVTFAVKVGNADFDKNSKIAVLDSTPGIEKTILASNANYQIVHYSSTSEALQAVRSGTVDGFANSLHVLNYVLENPIYDDMTVANYQEIPIPYYIGGKTSSLILQSILNKAIRSISETTVEQIVRDNSKFSLSELSFGDQLYLYRTTILFVVMFVVFILIILGFYVYNREQYIKKIEETSKELEHASKAKSDFLSNMSHDMRTPMNGILGITRLSEGEKDPKVLQENIHKIQDSGEYLLELINNTLDFQKIQSGKLELNETCTDRKEFVHNVMDMLEETAMKKNIKIYCDIDENELWPYVKYDVMRLKQIIVNLASNSIKYTPEGGHIEISAHIESKEGNIETDIIQVKDSGVGMSKDFIENHIFKPFSQEYNEYSSQYSGSGLGLSIVKSNVELMGGKIEVESELGHGTNFILHIPFQCVTKDDVIVKDQQFSDEECHRILDGKHILIVEDHHLNAQIATKLLEKMGCIVTWADNGQKGYEAFVREKQYYYDAILMDIRMPVLDGLEATRKIRNYSRVDAKYIPIIAMTANAFDEDIKKSTSVGMSAHLSKPIDPSLLYFTLSKCISHENIQ